MLEVNFDPFPELNTERLLLRRVLSTDIDLLFKLRSDQDVMKYIEHGFAKKREDAEEHFQKIDNGLITNSGITWGIALKKAPSELIGTVGLWQLIKEHYRAEIGYALLTDHWNKGYMKEACKEIMQYGFDVMGIHSVEARIHPSNTASAALLESLAFTREGYFKENYFFEGRFGDTAVYSKIKEKSSRIAHRQ